MANKITTSIKKLAAPFWPQYRPAGNVLEGNAIQKDGKRIQVWDQNSVKLAEPYGTKAPNKILDRASGWSEIANLSHDFTVQKIQSAFRSAERGDMRLLFGYYRDFFLANGMVASELSKRKLSTISEPFNILPADKKNIDDVKAAEVIAEALDRCNNFRDGLIHLMNAIIYPVSVLEKTFEPIDESYGTNKHNLRYKIKQLYPVDYNLINYRLPYLPQGPINIGNQPVIPAPPLTQNMTGRPEDTIFDPDSWEPNLRFWSVFQNGLIDFSYADMMAPDPDRHVVYRSNLLQGIARENWGGLGRSLLWWAMMSQMGADIFLKCLQKYGVPFIVANVDMSQVDTVEQIMNAFGNLNVVNAMAVNKDALVTIQEMNYSGAADAHEKFLQFCHDQISLLISGQTLSSHAKSTGLGSGVADLQGRVRQDIINFDRQCLNDVLRTQLFRQYLDINGIKGNTPIISWGGDNELDSLTLSNTISNLKNAGIQPTDDAIEQLSENFGFTIEKIDDNNDENIIDVINEEGKESTNGEEIPNEDDSVKTEKETTNQEPEIDSTETEV